MVAVLAVAVGCGKKNKDEEPEPSPVDTVAQSGGVVMVPGLPPQPLIPNDDANPKPARAGDIAVVGVTIAGGQIYFLDQLVGGVVRQPIAGGEPKVLGNFATAMTWASAGSSSVFFIAGSALKSVPLEGGKVVDVSPRLANPRGIAADGDAVYVVYGQSFGVGPAGPDGVVAKFTADGVQTMIADRQAGPIAVALDDTHVYWTVKGALMRAPKAGGGAETVASLPNEYAWHLALGEKHAYITVQGNAGTYIAQVAKADGAVKQLARLHNQPVDIAIGDKLYFTAESATPGVATLWSFDPTDAKLTSVATGLTGMPFLAASATHVVWASAESVYWLRYGETKPLSVRVEKQ